MVGRVSSLQNIGRWPALSWAALGLCSLFLFGCPDESSKKPQARGAPSEAASGVSLEQGLAAAPGTAAHAAGLAQVGKLTPQELWRTARSSASEDQHMLARQLFGAPEARMWAAFGLGLSCEHADKKRTVSLLSSAVASWLGDSAASTERDLETAAWAMGACATDEAESVLASWLAPQSDGHLRALVRAAGLGLGSYADRRGRLSERTQSAILSAAAREKNARLLLALGRVNRLSDAIGAHLLEVVEQVIASGGVEGRRAALFALERAGSSAVGPLTQVLLSTGFERAERAAAAQALAQLGRGGQKALDEVVGDVLSKGLPKQFGDARWIPLRAALLGLERPERSRGVLSQLRSAPVPSDQEPSAQAARRRLIWLRCRAEDLLAQKRFDSSGLLSCDPDRGRDFLLAQLRVLDRSHLDQRAAARALELLAHPDPVVAQAALRLYAGHPELPEPRARLVAALRSPVAGTRTTAAQLVSNYPDRVFSQQADEPPEDVIAALSAILSDDSSPLETQAAALLAAGASRALTLKPLVEELCAGPDEAVWGPAATALALLGSPKTECGQRNRTARGSAARGLAAATGATATGGAAAPGSPAEPGGRAATAAATSGTAASPAVVELIAQSDVGTLTLRVDASSAPHAVEHFLRQVDAGFYDGLSIHAAREGFAVQFGDKNGDGYDDTRSPGLPNELAPEPFGKYSFGLGAFAPGTHDTQVFVVLADAPQLTGTRVRLGTVEGPWDSLVVGDVIHSLRRK